MSAARLSPAVLADERDVSQKAGISSLLEFNRRFDHWQGALGMSTRSPMSQVMAAVNGERWMKPFASSVVVADLASKMTAQSGVAAIAEQFGLQQAARESAIRSITKSKVSPALYSSGIAELTKSLQGPSLVKAFESPILGFAGSSGSSAAERLLRRSDLQPVLADFSRRSGLAAAGRSGGLSALMSGMATTRLGPTQAPVFRPFQSGPTAFESLLAAYVRPASLVATESLLTPSFRAITESLARTYVPPGFSASVLSGLIREVDVLGSLGLDVLPEPLVDWLESNAAEDLWVDDGWRLPGSPGTLGYPVLTAAGFKVISDLAWAAMPFVVAGEAYVVVQDAAPAAVNWVGEQLETWQVLLFLVSVAAWLSGAIWKYRRLGE